MYVNSIFNTGTTEYRHLSVNFARDSHAVDYCHDLYELLYVAEGTGEYSAEGKTGDLKPGTLMLLCPYEFHKIIPTLNKPLDYYIVKFNRKCLVSELGNRFDSLFSRDLSTRILMSSTVMVHSLLERIESSFAMQDADRALSVKMLLSEIIMLLSFNEEAVSDIEKGELGARVIKYLNENIDRDLSLDYIAQRFFVSKYYLCRAFKKHNGISVHGYINKKRVLYAKALIEGGAAAADAAYKVGFGDYSAFYRAYVKQLGTSPTEASHGKVAREESL